MRLKASPALKGLITCAVLKVVNYTIRVRQEFYLNNMVELMNVTHCCVMYVILKGAPLPW